VKPISTVSAVRWDPVIAEDDGPLDSGKAAREPSMDCSATTVSIGLVTGQLASDRPYDQSPGEAPPSWPSRASVHQLDIKSSEWRRNIGR